MRATLGNQVLEITQEATWSTGGVLKNPVDACTGASNHNSLMGLGVNTTLPVVVRPMQRPPFDRWSVPGPGRTVAGSAELWGSPLRQAISIIEESISETPCDLFARSFTPRDAGLDSVTPHRTESAQRRIALALASQWLIGRSIGTLDRGATLADAEVWFWGSHHHNHELSSFVSAQGQGEALGILRSLDLNDQFRDLLPYILDPYGPGTRRSVLSNPQTVKARTVKRKMGVFYTPADVAEYMVSTVIEGFSPQCNIRLLDPACGTGVFLLAAFRKIIERTSKPILEVLPYLYGLDISALAIDSCAYVLTHECLQKSVDCTVAPAAIWHAIRMNLAVVDALTVVGQPGGNPSIFSTSRAEQRVRIRSNLLSGEIPTSDPLLEDTKNYPGQPMTIPRLFPEVGEGFNVVVANPPYAPIGSRPDLLSISRGFESLKHIGARPSVNMFIPFVEMMWRFAKPRNSRSAMIVPLSIAYSSSNNIKELRRALELSRGEWRFAFFDRTPDALFGDDVKQRCSILFRIADENDDLRFLTGPLQRWTSRTRYKLFQGLQFTPLNNLSISEFIPKLEGDIQVQVYKSLRMRPERFGASWVGARRSSSTRPDLSGNCVFVANTAYNRLSVYRSLDPLKEISASPCGSPLLQLHFSSSNEADSAFAIILSRLVYWLWRVEGDGFHVPLSFLHRIPLSPKTFNERLSKELEELGRSLWKHMLMHPVIAVNSGKRTVSFSTLACDTELDEIDKLLVASMGLPSTFADTLRNFVINTVLVDPTDETRIASRLSTVMMRRDSFYEGCNL